MLCFSSSHSVPSSEVQNRDARIHNKFSFKNMPKCVARSETNLVNTDVAKFFFFVNKEGYKRETTLLHLSHRWRQQDLNPRTSNLMFTCLELWPRYLEPPCHDSSVVNDCKRGMMSARLQSGGPGFDSKRGKNVLCLSLSPLSSKST